ncbi:MAG: hypothetical protein ACI88A_003463 [Paraglaciecola sp.]|jgi:hypothetical protein
MLLISKRNKLYWELQMNIGFMASIEVAASSAKLPFLSLVVLNFTIISVAW